MSASKLKGAATLRNAGGDPSNVERLPGTFVSMDRVKIKQVPPKLLVKEIALQAALPLDGNTDVPGKELRNTHLGASAVFEHGGANA